MSKSSVGHDPVVFEDKDGSAFAGCACGWVGTAYEDHLVDDDQPPFAIAAAYNERYGHMHRTRQGLAQ